MALCISQLKSGKSDGNKGFTSDHLLTSAKRLHILPSLLYKSILFYGYILHMNCYYPPLYLSPKILNHHYTLLIIIEEYLYSILLQKCLIMLLLNYLAAVFKPSICNLPIKQNILQHYTPWFILRLCIIMLTMVVML